MFRALLDTCVLFKPLLCDTLLCIAEEGVYLPMWSDDILDELRRNLIRYRISERAVEYRVGQMTAHFPTSMVTGHQTLIGAMTNSAKDRHVLAAAVRGHADVIVTENVRDFPPTAVDRLKVGGVPSGHIPARSARSRSGCGRRRARPAGVALPS